MQRVVDLHKYFCKELQRFEFPWVTGFNISPLKLEICDIITIKKLYNASKMAFKLGFLLAKMIRMLECQI